MSRTLILGIVATFALQGTARADWGVELRGPHGTIAFGDRDYVEYDDGVDSYGSYEELLAPHGRFTYLSGYGRCFIPRVTHGWRPFQYGRWIYGYDGWTWCSYEPWGYIPHHYGSWRVIGGYGWCWFPGYTYSPAPVSWYYGGGYVGWYPSGIHVDIDIDIDIINVCHGRDFTSGSLHRAMLSAAHIPSAMRASFRGGPMRSPSVGLIERHVGRRIEAVAMAERTVRVGGKALRVAAPTGEHRRQVLSSARAVADRVVPGRPRPESASPHREQPGPRPSVAERPGRLERPSRELPSPRVTKPSPRVERPSVAERPGRLEHPRRELPSPKVTKPSPRVERPSVAERPGRLEHPRRELPSPRVTKPSPRMERPSVAERPGKLERPRRELPSPRVTKPSPRMERPSVAERPGRLERPRREAPSPRVTKPSSRAERPSTTARQGRAERPAPRMSKPSRPESKATRDQPRKAKPSKQEEKARRPASLDRA